VAPGILGYDQAASDNGHIIGPVIATFSFIALWEATHDVRKWNYPLGIWLLLAPWVLGYGLTVAIISDMVVGVLVVLFSAVPQKIEGRYGGGWAALWKSDPEHMADHNRKNFN
ncbi:MAG TPA: SPW repeat protein, partial [Pricia sp.]|nr:SPW repeat protein [Pricia sp.]